MAESSRNGLLHHWFPWTSRPFVCSAPMRTVSGPALAAAVSQAGGLGFIGAGYDTDSLSTLLSGSHSLFASSERPPLPSGAPASSDASSLEYAADIAKFGPLRVGLGIILFKADLQPVVTALEAYRVCAVWLFAPTSPQQLHEWLRTIRAKAPECKIFLQVGSVGEAEDALAHVPGCVDVLVAQGVADSGGHGLLHGASIVSLVPEIAGLVRERGAKIAVVAAGGIVDGKGTAAALCLGAHGVCMGTRFIAAEESEAAEGFRRTVIEARDGGIGTRRTRVYDEARGTGFWPENIGGRGIVNRTLQEFEGGMEMEEIKKQYGEALEKDDWQWLTAYAGTAVGGVKEVLPAGAIVEKTQQETWEILRAMADF